MSEHSLPDDVSQWPDDPNELLGVTYGMSPRDLRRAYNRLIRIYKPEQFPEQFRRIREAYEYLLRIAELFASPTEASDAPPADAPLILPTPQQPPSEKESEEWIADSPQLIEENLEARRTRSPDEEWDARWDEAIAGSPDAAYERLSQMTQQYAGRTELYLRLYWLRTLFPEVDARRVPSDWLVQGLLATGFAGPLRELYREEVANDPAEALTERYGRLLDAPLSAALLADLIEWRLHAAVRLERWSALADDVQRLRGRFGLEEDHLWLRLLFGLCDVLAWKVDAEATALFAVCRAEIDRNQHLAQKLSFLFDRHDLLISASAGWHDLILFSRIPAPLLRLLADSWSRPFAEVRASLLEILDWMTEAPGICLDHFDTMHKRAPTRLALFGELLDQFEQSLQIEQERDDRSDVARTFLAQLMTHYSGERNRLLMFCLREDIAPEEIAAVASEDWASTINADWPLRYVCRACRLFSA